jgi:CRISPR-associated protein Cas5t
MRVLKVVLEGMTTSFRYPHFMMSVQPTFLMPPPATIYGLICSTLGEWVDPRGLAFAYHFTSQGSVEDVEHIHVLSASGGKLPGTAYPKVLEGNVNPFRRQILFTPRLVLYLNRPEWESAFRHPAYPVVLGRSQDLATYTSIGVVDLEQSQEAYFEHTLLPYDMATQTAVGIVTLMPRWLDYEQNRRPAFERYLLLQRPILSRELLQFEGDSAGYATDPTAPRYKEVPLGLIFHTFTGGRYDPYALAS